MHISVVLCIIMQVIATKSIHIIILELMNLLDGIFVPGKFSSLILSVLMSSVLTNYVSVHRYRFWSKHVQWYNELE